MQRLPSLCLLLLIPGTLPAEAASETEPKVVCSLSAPAVEFGGEIKLGAWARTTGGHRLTYRWSTDAGAIVAGKAGEAVWNMKDTEGGSQFAKVEVRDGARKIGDCGVRVQVVRSLAEAAAGRGEGERVAVRALLYESTAAGSRDAEPTDLGLYSYLILGNNDQAKSLPVLRVLVSSIPALLAAMAQGDRKTANANFVPVTGKQEAGDKPNDASWVLSRYDYGRASLWRNKIPNKGNDGIFLVSSRKPLLERKPGEEILVLDLTEVPADLASVWVQKFVNQAAQTDFSKSSTLKFMLGVRLNLELLTQGTTNVRAAIKLASAK